MPDKINIIPSIQPFTQPSKTIRAFLLAIFCAGLFLRLMYFSTLPEDPLTKISIASDVYDQYRFFKLARDFVENGWLGSEVTKYSPSYSYFIAAIFKIFGKNLYYVFAVQMILGSLMILLAYKTASLLFKNKIVGLIAATLTCFYGPFLFYEGTLLRASLIALSNLFGFYCLLSAFQKNKPSLYFGAGLAIGISLILRPNILPFFIIPYLWITSKSSIKIRLLHITLFIIGIMIFVLPLNMRNKALQKDLPFSYQGPSTFWIGNTPDATGIGLYRSPLRMQFTREAKGNIGKTFSILFREIKNNPQQYKELYLRKIKMFLNGYEIPANLSFTQAAENSVILRITFLDFVLIGPLALLGLILSFKRTSNLNLLHIFLLTLSLSVIAFHIQGRYRLPSIPFFIILASYTIYWLIETFQRRYFLSTAGAFILFIIFSLWTRPDYYIIHKYFGSPIRPSDYSNLASAYMHVYNMNKHKIDTKTRTKYFQTAITNLEKAIKYVPPKEREYKITCYLLKGLLEYELNNDIAGDASIKAAFALEPDRPYRVKNLLNEVIKKYQPATAKAKLLPYLSE